MQRSSRRGFRDLYILQRLPRRGFCDLYSLQRSPRGGFRDVYMLQRSPRRGFRDLYMLQRSPRRGFRDLYILQRLPLPPFRCLYMFQSSPRRPFATFASGPRPPSLRTKDKVRLGETPRPVRETHALPGNGRLASGDSSTPPGDERTVFGVTLAGIGGARGGGGGK